MENFLKYYIIKGLFIYFKIYKEFANNKRTILSLTGIKAILRNPLATYLSDVLTGNNPQRIEWIDNYQDPQIQRAIQALPEEEKALCWWSTWTRLEDKGQAVNILTAVGLNPPKII